MWNEILHTKNLWKITITSKIRKSLRFKINVFYHALDLEKREHICILQCLKLRKLLDCPDSIKLKSFCWNYHAEFGCPGDILVKT